MLRTLPFPARLSLIALLVVPLFGQDGCNDPCPVDYILCDLNATNDGWCVSGSCVANACTGVDCDDANDCTVDSCNPMAGTCINVERDDFFPSCNAGGNSGVCFGTICEPVGSDPCVLAGVGRVNCCANQGCFGPVATCIPTSQRLISGTPCDPTGVEPPGQAGQAGTCNAVGECIYNTGNCAGVACQDDATQCVKESCDPETGQCEAAAFQGAPECDNQGSPGACIGGFCKSQNNCVSIGSGFNNCRLGCFVGEIEPIQPDLYCDPTGGFNPSLTNMALGGICSVDRDCVPELCAIPDPFNPGYFAEKSCEDDNECTVDECDPDTGACTNTGLPDFTPCDGGQGVCFSGWSSIGVTVPSWCLNMP